MTMFAIRVRRMAASRRPRVAAALAAAALMASLTGAARQPASIYPVQAAFASPGPYATTTGTVTDSAGTVIYDVFRPVTGGTVRAVAVPVHRGRTTVTAQTSVYDDTERLVAQTTQVQAVR